MKKYLVYILVCLMFLGIFSRAGTLDAAVTLTPAQQLQYNALSNEQKAKYQQAVTVGAGNLTPAQVDQALSNAAGNTTGNTINVDPNAAVNPNANLPTANTNGTPLTNGVPELSLWDTSSWIPAICVGILKIFAWLLYATGLLLNFVLKYTVLNMNKNMSTMTGINVGWKVIKDLMNIAFIFILIYQAIMLIIGQGTRAKITSFVGFVVLASLLVNFSLFFTRVIIDASNIATVGFYNSILGDTPTGDTGLDYGLANIFMKSLGLSSYYEGAGSVSTFSANLGGDKVGFIIFTLMGCLLFLVLSFVFFSVAIMFLMRYMILILLLTLSPVGFMGMALPQMKKQASEWWETLTGQCLFGPVYMIFTWVILTLIASPGFISNGGGDAVWANLYGQNGKIAPGALGLIINFAIIIGLTITSLSQAKKLATQGGAKLVGDVVGKGTAFMGGAILGGAAMVSRNTIGKAGDAISQNEWVKNRAAEGKFGGRAMLNLSNKAATSTFDARNTKTLGFAAKQAGIDVGKGADAKKSTFREIKKTEQEKDKKFVEGLKPSGDATEAVKTAKEQELGKEAFQSARDAATKAHQDGVDALEQDNIKLGKLEAQLAAAQTANDANLIAQISGQVETQKRAIGQKVASVKNLDSARKAAQSQLDKVNEKVKAATDALYKDKIEKYAQKIDRDSNPDDNVMLWAKNALKIAAIPLGYRGNISTSADRREAARAVRKLKDDKKPTKKKDIEDLLGIKIDDSKQDADEATPVATPAAPATPAPTNP